MQKDARGQIHRRGHGRLYTAPLNREDDARCHSNHHWGHDVDGAVPHGEFCRWSQNSFRSFGRGAKSAKARLPTPVLTGSGFEGLGECPLSASDDAPLSLPSIIPMTP